MANKMKRPVDWPPKDSWFVGDPVDPELTDKDRLALWNKIGADINKRAAARKEAGIITVYVVETDKGKVGVDDLDGAVNLARKHGRTSVQPVNMPSAEFDALPDGH